MKIVIINACRTPIGKLSGHLSSFTAPCLGSLVIKELMNRTAIAPSQIGEVIMGNVVSAGLGQNPARQAALLAGLPKSVSAFTINKVCASGLKAVASGVQAIQTGDAEVVIAGGMESMSNAPFLLKDMRQGRKYGDSQVIDSMIHDGLWDSFYDSHMGTLCELTAKKYGISRKEQDSFALQSHKKAADATESGRFRDEIAPVRLKQKTGYVSIERDESIRFDTTPEQLAVLKPVFEKGGTITAGNAPGLNDGAAVLLLMSEKKAKSLKLTPLAEITGYSSAYLDPKWYPLAPVTAVKSVLKRTGLSIKKIDMVEENEAFAAQSLAVIKELGLGSKKVNVNGGAIALGHPIGASGARILVTLIYALKNSKKELGLATLCLGGGGAMSMIVRV